MYFISIAGSAENRNNELMTEICMKQAKMIWEERIVNALGAFAKQAGIDSAAITGTQILIQTPPKPEMGDFAIPFFPFAKLFRLPPAKIAAGVAALLQQHAEAEITVSGPYVNIKLDLTDDFAELLEKLDKNGEGYGRSTNLDGENIMIEFSCPNTNKPLHLGHLRNDALGASMAEILSANGASVRKVNLINDRGVHICKSMLAYREFGNKATPESQGMKSDHFVGKYYVAYNNWSQEERRAEDAAQQMLVDWESGDPETVALWEQMNRWAIDGIFETYAKTGISFDDLYYESRTYKRGKQIILDGLAEGIFSQAEDGSIWIDLEEIGLDRKVLLRSDGTSLYLTQDIGTAVARHEDWPFTSLIYVVGSEQQYHFRVLFHVLDKLGYPWAANLYHLSYGMVNLPDGKMKSREGTVVDADDLLETLTEMARNEIIRKGRSNAVEGLDTTAASIALGALNYYLLQVSPTKDMVFNPSDSISFNGNTGPYLQYMGARISSMLRKHSEQTRIVKGAEQPNISLLQLQDEHDLIKLILQFPDIVEQAAEQMNPAVISAYLYDISRLYSRYYHDTPIMRAEDPALALARVTLSRALLQVLQNAFVLVGIPFLERM